VIRSAPGTFARKTDAEGYLTLIEAQLARSEWIALDRGKEGARTIQLYRWTIDQHITPHLGAMPLNRLDTPMIRA
jgi:hypothetical protein